MDPVQSATTEAVCSEVDAAHTVRLHCAASEPVCVLESSCRIGEIERVFQKQLQSVNFHSVF